MSKPQMMKVAEAASYLGVSRGLLNKLRVTGGGPIYYTIGRLVRYSPADLDVWLSEQRRSSTSEYAVPQLDV